MHFHGARGAFREFTQLDLLFAGYKAEIMQWLFVLAAPTVGVTGVILVIESHAGADDVDDRQTMMAERSFDQGFHLVGVTGKGPGDKSCARRHSFLNDIYRSKVVLPLVF